MDSHSPFSPDGRVCKVLVGADRPEDVARLQAGRRARGARGERHVLQCHQQRLALVGRESRVVSDQLHFEYLI